MKPEQIPVGMAIVVFAQTFGGALFATFAQLIFNNSLLAGLAKYAPTVNAGMVVEAGATAIRQVVKPADLLGVLQAYNVSVNHNFYLAAGASVGSFIFCWGMGWKKIEKEKKVEKEDTAV